MLVYRNTSNCYILALYVSLLITVFFKIFYKDYFIYKYSCIFFLSKLHASYLFFLPIALERTFSRMSHRSGKNRHLCLSLDLCGEWFQSFTMRYNGVSCRFLWVTFTRFRKFLFIPNLYHKWLLDSVMCSSSSSSSFFSSFFFGIY